MEEEVKRMKEYLLKQMKQKGHLSYEKQIKYLKRFKDGVLGDNPRSMARKDAAEELLKNSEQDLAKKIEQLKESNQNTTIMNHEFLRMQELAGVPVNEEKESLNEVYVAGGIVGVGAINHPKREKSDYEMAFEHFMTEGEEKEVEEMMHKDEVEEGYYEEDDTMEEAVGIDASAEAIRGEVRRLIDKFDNDEDLGMAVRNKFSK